MTFLNESKIKLFMYVFTVSSACCALTIATMDRTGATGYIGGEILHRITSAIPDVEITALVRDVQKGTQLSYNYPNVHIVHGDLDDSEMIEKAVGEADVVARVYSSSPVWSNEA